MTHSPFEAVSHRSLRRLCIVAVLAAGAVPLSVNGAPTADARAFLVGVYRHYPTTDTPGAFDPVGADAPKIFTPDLTGLIRQDQKFANGEVGALDGDPLCDCQDDGGLQAKVGAVSQTGPSSARALVTLTFAASSPPDVRRLVIRLSRVKGGWRIADIQSASEASLRAYLARSNRDHATRR